MIKNWFIRFFWDPFEALSLAFPLIPIKFQILTVAPDVQMILLNNIATKFLSRFGGGFDYAVIYLINGELVFDTGYSWAQRILQKKVFHLIDMNKIRFIVNSHDHEDHTGNNSLFLKFTRMAKSYSHPLARVNILFPPPKPWYRRFLFGPEVPSEVELSPNFFTLSNGRVIEVIHTPGHTDGHICLYDRENKTLLTGDLFISELLDTQLAEANGPKWITSLEKVLELPIETILDGHGVILRGSECKNKLKLKLEFLLLLRSRVREITSHGAIITLW